MSPFPSSVDERRCGWCSTPLATRSGRFCSQKCRQAAFRIRVRGLPEPSTSDRPMRFIYADPPYPGKAKRYYSKEPSYGGEVNHHRLIAQLICSDADGWALSTSEESLRDLLPLCPRGARVCPWVKTHPASVRTAGLHNVWEALIVFGGRPRRPGVRDALVAAVARQGGSSLPGRKPLKFCAWLFSALGMRPGDELTDLFPGSGTVTRAWRELSSRPSTTERGNG